jgi:TRAP-type C4-dicarboxylate transport system permease small subunit
MWDKLGRGATAAIEVATGGAVVAIAVILVLQVVSRYILRYPLAWPEEMAGFLFVWLIFLGAPLAYRAGALIGLTFVLDALPPSLRRAIIITIQMIVIAFLAFLTYEGLVATKLAWTKSTTVLGFSWAWVYAALPVGTFILTACYARKLRRTLGKPAGDAGKDGTS